MALMYEAEYDHPDIAGELPARKGDDNIVNNDKISTLQLAEAEERKNQDVVWILKAGKNKDN